MLRWLCCRWRCVARDAGRKLLWTREQAILAAIGRDGITAAYSLHFGGVLSHATWPAVNCHQLYQHDLLAEPIVVEGEQQKFPIRSTRLRTRSRRSGSLSRGQAKATPGATQADQDNLGFRQGDVHGKRWNGKLHAACRQRGEIRLLRKGAHTELVPNNGSAKWKRLYEKARNQGPFRAIGELLPI